MICLAGGLAVSAIAQADDSTAARFPGQNLNLKQRMELLRKLHHKHAPLPQPDNAQLTSTPATQPAAAAAPVDPNNPYSSIVSRNVFGLNPIPPPVPQDQQDGPPPPKITLTGITTIFGPAEALFNVAGVVRNGQPPHDESYIFGEGEEEDDVQVVSIDTKGNVVKFNNHGTEQVIALTEGTASSGSAPSSPTWPGQHFRQRRFGRNGGPGNFPPPFQPQSYNNAQPDNGNGDSGANSQAGGFNSDNNSSGNVHNYSTVSPAVAALSPEDQDALIAAQHAQLEQEANPPYPPAIMPPTPFDDEARQAAAGDNSGK